MKTEEERALSVLGKLLIGATIIALLVVGIGGCFKKEDPTPEELEAQKKAEIKQAIMKRDKKGEFIEQATYGDNCKIGEMSWYNDTSRNYPRSMQVVICDNAKTTSVQYRVGKFNAEHAVIEYSKAELEDALKKKAEAEAKEKAEALGKLTDREKEMLGLK